MTIYYYLIRIMGIKRSKVEDFFFRLCNTSRIENSIYNTTITNLSDKDYIGRSGTKRTDEYISCWNAMLHNCTVQRRKYSDWFEMPNNNEDENELVC